PEKIPRPPNAFIVFRTEFAHLHHNPQVSRSRRGNGAKVLGRTVSGKAADAWRLLSPEEKQHYVRLADLEKEKHARKHPNYQYRPKRRENAARR
ncbi:high mobility group box domain-containing protein, partial [Mycena sp. CBHHK59/15]